MSKFIKMEVKQTGRSRCFEFSIGVPQEEPKEPQEEFEGKVRTMANHNWKYYNDVATEDKADIDLKGKTVCITGTFAKTRNEITKELEDKGVIVKKGIVKNLDYLIAGIDGGSKVIKAQEKNIPIIGEKALNSFLQEDLGITWTRSNKPIGYTAGQGRQRNKFKDGLPKPVELPPKEEELNENELVF